MKRVPWHLRVCSSLCAVCVVLFSPSRATVSLGEGVSHPRVWMQSPRCQQSRGRVLTKRILESGGELLLPSCSSVLCTQIPKFFTFLYFKTRPYFVALACLKLAMELRLALNLWWSCHLCLPSARMTPLYHHTCVLLFLDRVNDPAVLGLQSLCMRTVVEVDILEDGLPLNWTFIYLVNKAIEKLGKTCMLHFC